MREEFLARCQEPKREGQRLKEGELSAGWARRAEEILNRPAMQAILNARDKKGALEKLGGEVKREWRTLVLYLSLAVGMVASVKHYGTTPEQIWPQWAKDVNAVTSIISPDYPIRFEYDPEKNMIIFNVEEKIGKGSSDNILSEKPVGWQCEKGQCTLSKANITL